MYKEISGIYEKEILSGVSNIIPQSSAVAIQQAILNKDPDELKRQLEKFLKQTISTFDTGYEGFYHGWLLGIYAIMNNLYKVTSNRESGDGRYDIGMTPLYRSMPAILIEIKVLRKEDASTESTDLKQLAKGALRQINDKNYAAEFKQSGVKQIVKYGIAFYRKQVELCSETESL